MGQPARIHLRAPQAEHIGLKEGTRGTETSQYPEEKKANAIPSVAASEIGTAQTRLRAGVVGANVAHRIVL